MDGTEPCLTDDFSNDFHEYILDVINTKLYKPTIDKKTKKAPENLCVVYFSNKALEYISLPSIIRNSEIVKLLPENLRGEETIPVVTYKLGKTIRNKIFNFKQTIGSLMLETDNLHFLDDMNCNCSESSFCDPYHKHVITGNLNIVQHNALKKLLSKGPNFREKKTINFSKAKNDIISSLDALIDNLVAKYNHQKLDFQSWKEKIIEMMDTKI